MTKRKYYEGRGSRKRSKARVRIYEGSEASTVNDLPSEDFFKGYSHEEEVANRPIVATGLSGKVFYSAKVAGGGITGQTGAIQLGIARALLKLDEGLHAPLKKEDLLSRDPREKERKKYFLRKARKRPQFSKR